MKTFTREDIELFLSSGACTVKFTKVDGTDRVMHCTIDQHLIPEDKQPKGILFTEYLPTRAELGQFRVFDLDKNEWRSFRIKNVTDLYVGLVDID